MLDEEKYIDGYRKLAGAITIQAVNDFRKAVKHLTEDKGNPATDVGVIKEVIAFVKSVWFTTLTNVQPEIVLKKLQEEVDQSGIREIIGNKRYGEFITTTFYSDIQASR